MTDAKKSLEKMVNLFNKAIEENRQLEITIRDLKEEIFKLNNRIIKQHEKLNEQHNLLCEHGLAEYGN